MNWIDITQSIYERLDATGFHDVSKEILDEQLHGGTGGEAFTYVVYKLIEIKEQKPEAYAVIKEETEWMIAYAKKINYL